MRRALDDARTWPKAQEYIEKLFAPEDAALKAALAQSRRAGLPPIAVSPAGGKLLYLLAKAVSARRILEVGTLGGYSAIWLARALPPAGRLVTLELDPEHAAVARKNIARAGLSRRIDVLTGPALRLMREMTKSLLPFFDMVFIDADKDEYPDYLKLAYRLVRRGGLIVADNALRRAVDQQGPRAWPSRGTSTPLGDRIRGKLHGILECNRLAAAHKGLDSVIVPVLGKGVDGMLVCVKQK